jgi:hypothetical protein
MKVRLVKIISNLTGNQWYQIQKKTLLFGWIGIGSRKTGEIGDFDLLEDAERKYKCLKNNNYYDIEVIK